MVGIVQNCYGTLTCIYWWGGSALSLLAGAVSNRSEAYLMGLGVLAIGAINRVRLEKLVKEKNRHVDALVENLFEKVPTQKGQ